jgi:hypothetical protein
LICAQISANVLPCDFTRGEMLFRVAGHAGRIEVRLLVADRTTHGSQAMTVRTALDRWNTIERG